MEYAAILRDYHKRTGATHYHSSLSVLPILLEIKDKMRPGDECILSKAHACTAFNLVFDGVLPDEPPVQGPFGSLGTGLPFAVGVAFMKPDNKVYVVMGDGEWQEGSNWEAYWLIRRLCLSNIEIHVDRNGMQGMGKTPLLNHYPNSLHVYLHKTNKGDSWECHYWAPE